MVDLLAGDGVEELGPLQVGVAVMARVGELGHRSVFLDFDGEAGIAAGSDWEKTLYEELRTCRAVIAVCTEHSMASKWVFAEITQARALGKHVFPLKVTPCQVEGTIRDTQLVDFVTLGEDEGFKRLRRGLEIAGVNAVETPSIGDGSRPPYPGLLAFQEEDAAIFFGRDAEIGQALDLMNRSHRFRVGPRHGVGCVRQREVVVGSL